MLYVGWVCCWTSLLALRGFCLATPVFASPLKLRVSSIEHTVTNLFTMIFGLLKYYICQNILFQADLQTLKCKQMIFEVYPIHSYSGILSIEHSLTFPNSNSTWNGRQRTTMWIPFPLIYLFIYSFIFFYYALLDECLTQKNQLTKETIPRNKFSIWTVLLTILRSLKGPVCLLKGEKNSKLKGLWWQWTTMEKVCGG